MHLLASCTLIHAFIKKRNTSLREFEKRVEKYVNVNRRSILQEVSIDDEILGEDCKLPHRENSKRKRVRLRETNACSFSFSVAPLENPYREEDIGDMQRNFKLPSLLQGKRRTFNEGQEKLGQLNEDHHLGVSIEERNFSVSK